MARHNILKKKFCWVATQTAKGWRIKASVGNKDYPIKGLVVMGQEDVEALVRKGGIVFVHLADSKTIPKKLIGAMKKIGKQTIQKGKK